MLEVAIQYTPKASSAKRVIEAALDDVEGQFNGGLLQVARPLLAALPDVAGDELMGCEALTKALVAAAVGAHRRLVEAEFATVGDMQKELGEMVKAANDKGGGANGAQGGP